MAETQPIGGPVDRLDAGTFSPLGATPAVVFDLADPGASAAALDLSARTQAIVIGVDRRGTLPGVDSAAFDVLLTTAADPPAPWVEDAKGAERLFTAIKASPLAASILCRVLRMGESLDVRAAVDLESLAYSTLLAGGEFAAWRAAIGGARPSPSGEGMGVGPLRQAQSPSTTPHPNPSPEGEGLKSDTGAQDQTVLYARDTSGVTLTLNRPATGNATTPEMRDALCEALAATLDDPSAPTVTLRAAGRCFSTGGDPADFGTARDLAQAHAIRTLRSPALLLHALGDRATVVQHGVSIGAGVEIAAAAAKRTALAGASFQLPELRMGLIPGAGGTVFVSRAIGRHRTAYLALTGRRIGAELARRWGLVHHIVPT